MSNEVHKKFEFNKTISLLGFAGMILGLSFLALDRIKVRERLRRNFRPIFDNLFENASEKEIVEAAFQNLPEGGEPELAEWLNKAMDKNERKIFKGQYRPHHVMVDVIEAALGLAGRKKR